MATVANVTLADTVDQERIKLNQVIKIVNDVETMTHPLANLAGYAANTANATANSAGNIAYSLITTNTAFYNNIAATSANITADLLLSDPATQNILNSAASTYMSDFLDDISFDLMFDTANGAYVQANTARTQGNTSYSQANLSMGRANSAGDIANSAYSQANSALSTAGIVGGRTVFAYNHANTAFFHANTAFGQANTARSHANTAFAQANSAFSQGTSAYGRANTGVTIASAAFGTANTAVTPSDLSTILTNRIASPTLFRVGSDNVNFLTASAVYTAATPIGIPATASIALDFSTGINFYVSGIWQNFTLLSPTNAKPGQSGTIYLQQDATGGRTIAFGANWKFAGGIIPALSTGAGRWDALHYKVLNPSFVEASLVKDVR